MEVVKCTIKLFMAVLPHQFVMTRTHKTEWNSTTEVDMLRYNSHWNVVIPGETSHWGPEPSRCPPSANMWTTIHPIMQDVSSAHQVSSNLMAYGTRRFNAAFIKIPILSGIKLILRIDKFILRFMSTCKHVVCFY